MVDPGNGRGGRGFTAVVMADVRNSSYPTPGMDAHQPSFGAYLRRWRQHRRMTQMELAVATDSSTQHLSYLETGRAQPSREMVMRLAEHLEVPLRERNTMLLSGGFAPAFQQRSLTELKSACLAIAQVLQTHKPYPAFAVDRYWNIVLSNEAIPQLYVDVAPELLRRHVLFLLEELRAKISGRSRRVHRPAAGVTEWGGQSPFVVCQPLCPALADHKKRWSALLIPGRCASGRIPALPWAR